MVLTLFVEYIFLEISQKMYSLEINYPSLLEDHFEMIVGNIWDINYFHLPSSAKPKLQLCWLAEIAL